jgi:hypothetical protein
MTDWTEALKTFRIEMSALPGSDISESLSPNTEVSLLRSISSKYKQGSALTSIANVEAAALLVKAMWKVGFTIRQLCAQSDFIRDTGLTQTRRRKQ